MELVISLSKPVTDENQAQQVYAIVKEKMADYPDVRVSGQIRAILEPIT